MLAVQAKASALRLWVVVPSMPTEKCILACPSPSLCAPMHQIVQTAVSKAVDQGYAGTLASPDAFVAGHSMGGACASNLVQGYAQTASVSTGTTTAPPRRDRCCVVRPPPCTRSKARARAQHTRPPPSHRVALKPSTELLGARRDGGFRRRE